LAKHFVDSGHRVAVVVHRTRPDLLPYEIRNGFEIYRFLFSTKNPLGRLRILPQALAHFYGILREFKPDIVHVQFLHINTLYPLMLSYLLPYTLILRAGGNDIHKFPVESRLWKFVLMWGFRRAHQLQFNSKSLMSDAAPYLPNGRDQIVIVGDGADPNEFDGCPSYVPVNGRPYIFTMGRLVYKKGFDLLIRSFPKVLQERPNLQLIIGGDGEEMPALKALVVALRLENHVSLVGYIDRIQAGSYLKSCEVFVLPSRIEPVGIVTMEAMSVAKPVLVTRVGGVPDIVEHGKSGWIVEPDSSALAEGLLHLLRHPELMRDLAKNGQQRMRTNFTWRKIADDCLEAYRQVLSARQE
jgi:glycosyltransferase involved in cell wall biosynthesis